MPTPEGLYSLDEINRAKQDAIAEFKRVQMLDDADLKKIDQLKKEYLSTQEALKKLQGDYETASGKARQFDEIAPQFEAVRKRNQELLRDSVKAKILSAVTGKCLQPEVLVSVLRDGRVAFDGDEIKLYDRDGKPSKSSSIEEHALAVLEEFPALKPPISKPGAGAFPLSYHGKPPTGKPPDLTTMEGAAAHLKTLILGQQ